MNMGIDPRVLDNIMRLLGNLMFAALGDPRATLVISSWTLLSCFKRKVLIAFVWYYPYRLLIARTLYQTLQNSFLSRHALFADLYNIMIHNHFFAFSKYAQDVRFYSRLLKSGGEINLPPDTEVPTETLVKNLYR